MPTVIKGVLFCIFFQPWVWYTNYILLLILLHLQRGTFKSSFQRSSLDFFEPRVLPTKWALIEWMTQTRMQESIDWHRVGEVRLFFYASFEQGVKLDGVSQFKDVFAQSLFIGAKSTANLTLDSSSHWLDIILNSVIMIYSIQKGPLENLCPWQWSMIFTLATQLESRVIHLVHYQDEPD